MREDLVKEPGFRYDMISLGEVMLRFDPGEGRVRTAREFRVYEGGGEYNVARALSAVFGMKTAVVTAIADNEVGALLTGLIRAGGVDTALIKAVPADGIGKNTRNGLNFVERGFGVRGAKGVSDRANTAVSQLKPGDVDWDGIFGLGVRWLHTGGIFAMLSPTTAQVALEAVKSAKAHGVTVSYDFNFRPSLWEACENKEQFSETAREILAYTDVVFGNEFDLIQTLGYAPDAGNLRAYDAVRYHKYMSAFLRDYPNVQLVLTTLRNCISASVNDWSAVGFTKSGIVTSPVSFPALATLDRIGGGDGFASGAIYALMHDKSPAQTLSYGVCHGALAMTTPGDTSMATLPEVERLTQGGSAAVQR